MAACACVPGRGPRTQEAARELSGHLDFRESLATMGEDAGPGVRPAALIAWGEANAIFPSGRIRIGVPVLAYLWVLSLLAWQVWGASELLVLAITLVNLGISIRFNARVSARPRTRPRKPATT